jgi:hypothetical protein
VEDFFHGGSYRNSVHYGLLSREWQASPHVVPVAVENLIV